MPQTRRQGRRQESYDPGPCIFVPGAAPEVSGLPADLVVQRPDCMQPSPDLPPPPSPSVAVLFIHRLLSLSMGAVSGRGFRILRGVSRLGFASRVPTLNDCFPIAAWRAQKGSREAGGGCMPCGELRRGLPELAGAERLHLR